MTEARNMMPGLPGSVVREDQKLEAAAEKASEALAELRWHWTDDESNEESVSYNVYARGVGKHPTTIAQFAKAYVRLAQSDGPGPSFTDLLQLVKMSADREVAVSAVAQAKDVGIRRVLDSRDRDVAEVRNALQNEAERREEKGKTFDAGEKEDYAKRLAEMKKRSRDREQRDREKRRANHGWQFQEGYALSSHIRRKAKELLEAVRGVEFDAEEVELLEGELDRTEATVRLAKAAVAGDSGTDWDAELQKLEEKIDG